MKVVIAAFMALCILPFAAALDQESQYDIFSSEDASTPQTLDALYSIKESNSNWTFYQKQKDEKMCSFLAQDILLAQSRIHGVIDENKIYPVCIFVNDSSNENIAKLASLVISYRSYRQDIICAEATGGSLKLIENLSFVSYIDVPRLHYSTRMPSMGVISKDLPNCTNDLLGICSLQEKNILGSGITMAILDSGFYYDRLMQLELPKNITLMANHIYNKNERHGTACAELINDIAPSINLYLVDAGSTDLDFIRAVENLALLGNKVDVILCARDFFSGSFSGDDEVCKAIKNITSNGTIWVNAAGDMALKHWSGNFNDPDGNGFNNFNQSDESINFAAERGDMINLQLSWEDLPLNAIQDFDLYLFAPDKTYYMSNNPQIGYFGHKPIETISIFAPSSGTYQIEIRKSNPAAKDVRFQLFSSHNLTEHDIPSSSLGILASSANVITVGAIDTSTQRLEPYSSMGPTMDGRIKPDLVAPDNVTTLTYFPEKFRGTSAAAPYVAGCIALAMEKLNSSNLDFRDLLTCNATDLGPAGLDNGYGHGLVDLGFLC